MDVPFALLAQSAPPPAAVGGSGTWLVYGVVLLAAALALFALEVFLPTGGTMGLAAGAAAVAGVVCFFRVNTAVGAAGAAVVLLTAPVLVVLALHIWPDTPIGQWLTNDNAQTRRSGDAARAAEAAGVAGGGTAAGRPGVGDRGRSVTPLRPVGVCDLNGRRHDCYARSGGIEPGTEVEVVSVSEGNVYVRGVEADVVSEVEDDAAGDPSPAVG